METVHQSEMRKHIDVYSTLIVDPRELYVEQIFAPNKFDVLTILKALNVSISSAGQS